MRLASLVLGAITFWSFSCVTSEKTDLNANDQKEWFVSLKRQANSANYQLKMYKASIANPKKLVLETNCVEESSTPGGLRGLCKNTGSELAKNITFVFRNDTRRGALLFYQDETAAFKALTCRLKGSTKASSELVCEKPTKPVALRDGLVSPFPSTIPGVTIPNSHLISRKPGKGAVYRGMAPSLDSDFAELIKKLHIDALVIYKDQTDGEVDREIKNFLNSQKLQATIVEQDPVLGQTQKQEKATAVKDKVEIHTIPFKYKEFESFEEPCRHTVQALKAISSASSLKKNVYVHCTVGEDRTGMLAALYRIIFDNVDVHTAFQNDMCENGYASGNPNKPIHDVVDPINDELTELYLKIAYKIAKKEITAGNLDEKVCVNDPATKADFSDSKLYDKTLYRCRMSTKYQPIKLQN